MSRPGDEVMRELSPLDAIPDMRSTARWTIAALGAVGAALLGVVPLGTLGKLDSVTDIVVVSAGLVLGVGGISWAIWHTAEALTPPVTTLPMVDDPELASLRKYVERSPEAFYGPFGSSVSELSDQLRFHERLATNLADAVQVESDADRKRALERTLGHARANVDLARSLQRQLLEFAHAWQVRAALRRSRLHTMTGVAVTVLGAILVMVSAADV